MKYYIDEKEMTLPAVLEKLVTELTFENYVAALEELLATGQTIVIPKEKYGPMLTVKMNCW